MSQSLTLKPPILFFRRHSIDTETGFKRDLIISNSYPLEPAFHLIVLQ